MKLNQFEVLLIAGILIMEILGTYYLYKLVHDNGQENG